ncbi:MAG: MlaA family lipoprotein, partial [Rhodospirillales bacterium]
MHIARQRRRNRKVRVLSGRYIHIPLIALTGAPREHCRAAFAVRMRKQDAPAKIAHSVCDAQCFSRQCRPPLGRLLARLAYPAMCAGFLPTLVLLASTHQRAAGMPVAYVVPRRIRRSRTPEKRAKMPINAPSRFIKSVSTALLIFVSFGCATAPDPSDTESYAEFRAINDPLEPLNRGVFEFNRALDAMFLRPFVDFYRLLLPPPVQEGVHNVLANLRSPVILVNDLLQGEWQRAGTTAQRLVVNTTMGVGGIGDPASDFGLPAHSEDFG